MKKISFLFLCFLSALFVQAQNETKLRTDAETKPRFGLKAGVNLAEFHASERPAGWTNYNTNRKTTFYGGLLLNLPIGSVLAIQPELLYSGAGSKVAFTPTMGSRVSLEQDLSYLTLPVMIQLRSPSGFFAEIGPQLGYLLKAQNDGAAPYNGDIKDNLDKIDFAANGGIGYTSRVGLGVNARYSWGLADIIDDNNSGGGKIRNRGIQIGLFYVLGAGQ
ncbi:porin family protein [Paraflavisolibacter sp. H34]|uniref:porin family protein n=1 Tax=Huijunlia imazamoxiresistens TaxID=3127457 RepID=UPI00301B4135